MGNNAENALLWLVNPHGFALPQKYVLIGSYVFKDSNGLDWAFYIDDTQPVLAVAPRGVSQTVNVGLLRIA